MKKQDNDDVPTNLAAMLETEFRQLFETLSKLELLYNPSVVKRTWRIRSLIKEMKASIAEKQRT
jgi:hypothetical protein